MFRTLRSVLRFRRFEFDSVKRRLARAASVADLRSISKRRLPGGVFDYIDGGAEDEIAMARNADAFRRVEFRPRVMQGVGDADPATTLLGRPLAFPLVLAPTGFTRIAHPDGELAVARAAERAGVPSSLSTLATRSIEEVAAVSSGALWFQVYVWRDRGLVEEMIRKHPTGLILCTNIDDITAISSNARPQPARLLNNDAEVLVLQHVVAGDTSGQRPGQEISLGRHPS